MNTVNNKGNVISLNLNEMADFMVVVKMRTKNIARKKYVNILSITFTPTKGKNVANLDTEEFFIENKCAMLSMEKFHLLFDDKNADVIGNQVLGLGKYQGFCYGGKIQLDIIK